jgi:hypothetical protein
MDAVESPSGLTVLKEEPMPGRTFGSMPGRGRRRERQSKLCCEDGPMHNELVSQNAMIRTAKHDRERRW